MEDKSKEARLVRWVESACPAQVAFVTMPFTWMPMPAIAPSTFKACLAEAGLTSYVLYAMFPFLELLDEQDIEVISTWQFASKIGEFAFAHLTDRPSPYSIEEFADYAWGNAVPEDRMSKEELTALIGRVREAAEALVDAVARKIQLMGARVVCASSIYYQQNGTFALFKRLKEIDPGIVTIVGGTNMTGSMGLAALHHYPSIDYVSFGEGDEIIADVCRIALGLQEGPMPYGILGHDDADTVLAPFRQTSDMNSLPLPDYSDYMQELENYSREPVGLQTIYMRMIYLEGSRGCWWGQRSVCTFCGLNGCKNIFRAKDPKHFYDEIRAMERRYPGSAIQLSDNILSQEMMKDLLPLLAGDGERHEIYTEIKSNITEEDLVRMRDAGFTEVQPGIEGLNDHLLKLMNKGNKAVNHVALLKRGAANDVTLSWNLLFGMPGEEPQDYEETIETVHKIVHLDPPTGVHALYFQRFSRYTEEPEAFNLSLEPHPVYRYLFGDDEEFLNDVAFIFTMKSDCPFRETKRQHYPLYNRVIDACNEWTALRKIDNPPRLEMVETPTGVSIVDTRPCSAMPFGRLEGVPADVLLAAWNPVSIETLCEKFVGKYAEDEIYAALDELIAENLVIHLSNRYLGLPILRKR